MAVLSVELGLLVGIEVSQFLFKKGLTEVDDVMHNTLGWVYKLGFTNVTL